jgi:hypothetical protein
LCKRRRNELQTREQGGQQEGTARHESSFSEA